ncbi:hypothetical protein [Solwaraspora sp. WMMA2101]|uniref:hypothetical protein n=1 Tax=Solwaraspora sp. WMMA2101 TaxID=3404124 RepID=UPI003B937728
MDTVHGLSAEGLLHDISPELVCGVTPDAPIPDDQLIMLTVAGARATGRADDLLDLFFRSVRLAVSREPSGEPGVPVRISSADVGTRLGFKRKNVKDLLPALYALLLVEPMGWRTVPTDAANGWLIEAPARAVRRFREAHDLPTYWAIRSTPAEPRPKQSGSEPARQRVTSDLGQIWPVVGAVPGLMILAGTATLLDKALLRTVATIALLFAGTALFRWYQRGLRWRRRRWWTTLVGAVLAVTVLTMSFLVGSSGDKAEAEPSDENATPAPPHGSCVQITGVTCRNLRLAVGQGFDLDAWRFDDGNRKDVRLVTADQLAPYNEASLSTAVPKPAGPLDPRACWTAGVWQPEPQVAAEGTRLCVRTAGNAYAALVRTSTPPTAAYDVEFLVAVATSDVTQGISEGAPVVVDNRVTAGNLMREDVSAYLTSEPANCGQPCALEQTQLHSGAKLNAICQTTGQQLTNGNLGDPADDANPYLDTSNLWYKIRWPDGRTGFLSEVWIRSADRGGLGLPLCR